jgi:beta-lactamase regulating signal transducer with metallopeptidase domain
MRIWFEINLILAFTYVVFFALRSIFNLKGKYTFENDTFKALGIMLFFPIIINLYPVDILLPPVVKKQFSESIAPTVEQIRAIRFSVPQAQTISSPKIELNDILMSLALLGLFVWFFRLFKDIKLIRRMLNNSVLIKKYGKVRLYLCPDLKVPCSFWFPTKYFALFPENVLLDKKLFAHALSHELQHHRQGDTKYIFLMEIFKAIFYINPFTHLWINRIHENRELKCDKEVLSRKGYEVREYGNTLIDVVKISSGIVLNRTWAMAPGFRKVDHSRKI